MIIDRLFDNLIYYQIYFYSIQMTQEKGGIFTFKFTYFSSYLFNTSSQLL